MIGISIVARTPKRVETDNELSGVVFLDEVFASGLSILGKMRMPIMIATMVSISVMEAKKSPNLFIFNNLV